MSKNPFVVDYAKFNVLKLVDAEGKFYDKIRISEAKQKAKDSNLDLVCFKEEDQEGLAFCRIIDYGKWKYEQGKKTKKSAVHKKDTKEVRFTPLIADNDMECKIKKAIQFLDRGDDVILSMRMKGRQLSHSKDAEAKLNEISAKCSNGKILKQYRSGNNFVVRMTKL